MTQLTSCAQRAVTHSRQDLRVSAHTHTHTHTHTVSIARSSSALPTDPIAVDDRAQCERIAQKRKRYQHVPTCVLCVLCCALSSQVIASSLINFIMLGVVFARFSAPFKRASTVRFSKVAVIHRHPSGFWALTLRVANLRKQQILQPAVRMVSEHNAAVHPAASRRAPAHDRTSTSALRVCHAADSVCVCVCVCVCQQVATAVDSITPSFYHHEQLAIEGLYKQVRHTYTHIYTHT